MKPASHALGWMAAVLVLGGCTTQKMSPLDELFFFLNMPAKPEQACAASTKLTALIPATESKTGSFSKVISINIPF